MATKNTMKTIVQYRINTIHTTITMIARINVMAQVYHYTSLRKLKAAFFMKE